MWGKLWLHESERVYADRLVSGPDLEAYSKAACAVAKKYFAIPDVDEFFRKKDPRPLMFCHFARSVSDKTYDEVRNESEQRRSQGVMGSCASLPPRIYTHRQQRSHCRAICSAATAVLSSSCRCQASSTCTRC